MKMKHRALTLLLSVAMLLTFMPAMAFAEGGGGAAVIIADKDTALVDEEITFTVTADGIERATLLVKGEEWDPDSDFDEWDENDSQGDNTVTLKASSEFAGKYLFCAQVFYKDGSSDKTNTLEITINKNGDVGEFDSEINTTTIKRGNKLIVTCNNGNAVENADRYWVDVERKEGKNWEWFDRFGYTDSPIIKFGTLAFPEGKYRITANAIGLGYERRESNNGFTVTVSGNPDDMILNVSKAKVQTCERFDFEVYCPGAQYFNIYPDYDGNRDWQWGKDETYTDTETFMADEGYGDAGTYRFHVEAFNKKGKRIKTVDKTITVSADKGDLELTVPELPSYLVAGKDSLSFTFNKPDNAIYIASEVGYDGEDDYYELYPYDDTEGNSLVVSVPADKLTEGMMIKVMLEAGGLGYNKTQTEIFIPVIGATSDAVKIEVSKTNIKIWERITATVSATGSEKIEKVQLCDGDMFWDEEEPGEDGTYKSEEFFYGIAAKYTLFARVKLEGSSEWVTTSPITVTVSSKGRAGEFAVTKINGVSNTGSVFVKPGETVKLTYTRSENAENYWANVFDRDWEYIRSYDDTDKLTMSLKIKGLKYGTYFLQVNAYGSEYEPYSADPIKLIVTNQKLTVKASKKTVKAAALKKKAQTVTALTVKGAKGKLTYKGVGANAKSQKALKINAKTGKITVKKGTKKGTYKMNVTVNAAAKGSYKAGGGNATVVIVVK